MENSLQRRFFDEFTKYPRDGALHELLENAVVVQVLNNRAERRMKVYLLFETYPDKSCRAQLEQAIQRRTACRKCASPPASVRTRSGRISVI